MTKKHALLSPSGAYQWATCTMSPQMQLGIPNKNSAASRAGTTCHQIQEEILLAHLDGKKVSPHAYVGRTFNFYVDPASGATSDGWADQPASGLTLEGSVAVTVEIAEAVHDAVESIVERHTLRGGQMLIERRVPIEHITGETGAMGSADVILLGDDWLEVIDSKFGRMRVEVATYSATGAMSPNWQASMYGSGAIEAYDVFGAIRTVTLGIVQPFIGHYEWVTLDVAELQKTIDNLSAKAGETRTNPKFAPSADACRFCRAATCQARDALAIETALDGFEDLTAPKVKPQPPPSELGTMYALVPFVRQWCDSIESATRKALESGTPVLRSDGLSYKLVAGRKGNRAWVDEEAVVQKLKSWRLRNEEMYAFKLASPTVIAQYAKPVGDEPPRIGGRRWATLQQFIRQNTTQPTIALSTDKRAALDTSLGFDEVSSTPGASH